MMFEIENSEKINFSKEQAVFCVGNRKVYKCKFKENSLKQNKNLKFSDLYYITNDEKDIENGAYVVLYFDNKSYDLIYFEFVRKTKEDIESIEYIVLDLIKKLGYDFKKYEKSINSNSYFKK